jgi:hypothetical protein
VKRLILAACVWGVLWHASALLFAQAHPCDSTPAGPWVVKSAQRPVIGWCQAGEHDGFQVSADGALFDIGKPVPAVAGAGIRGIYYAWAWPTGVAKGTAHTFGVRAYTATGGSAQAVLTFRR